MKTLADVSKKLAEQLVKAEDSGVSEFVKLQFNWLIQIGENPADYYLVRESGNLSYDGGTTIKQGVYYGLKHKDTINKIEYSKE